MVDRYSNKINDYEMGLSPASKYVLYADYKKLQAENEKLKKQVGEFVSEELFQKLQAEIELMKEEAKRAYCAIELLVPSKFIGLLKLPNGKVYNHRAFWEVLFLKENKAAKGD